jgi:hypothetical protein
VKPRKSTRFAPRRAQCLLPPLDSACGLCAGAGKVSDDDPPQAWPRSRPEGGRRSARPTPALEPWLDTSTPDLDTIPTLPRHPDTPTPVSIDTRPDTPTPVSGQCQAILTLDISGWRQAVSMVSKQNRHSDTRPPRHPRHPDTPTPVSIDTRPDTPTPVSGQCQAILTLDISGWRQAVSMVSKQNRHSDTRPPRHPRHPDTPDTRHPRHSDTSLQASMLTRCRPRC